MLVDAAAEPDRLLEMIGDDGITAVVTTHGHHDHWQALAEVVAATGAKTLAHADDVEMIDAPIDETVPDGGTINVGHVRLTAIHLVGHTPGSIALLYDDPTGAPHLFTGDCLFPGGVGNTQKDAERFASLLGDVRDQALRPAAGRDLGLPGPRQRHDARRRATAPRRSGRARGW